LGKLILSDEGEKKMNLVQITDYNFDPEVLKCDIPVLACFQAEWSAPAKKLGAILTEIANEYADRVKVALLNIVCLYCFENPNGYFIETRPGSSSAGR
jgi:thioredoxin-like negative regulator of GroEL